MKKVTFVFFVAFLGLSCMGQSDALIPWVTNNATFRSTVIITNVGDAEAEVFLVATRNDGSETAAARTIPAKGQLVESTATLFTDLGEGAGYSVIVAAPEGVDSAFIVSSTGSESGDSPAQGDASDLDNTGSILLFSYLPIRDAGASAPVVFNAGLEDAAIVFHAYQNSERVASSEAVTLPSGRPYAQITSELFPGVSGDIYVVAESDQPLIGTSFTFNSFLEPSMANARVISQLP